MAVKQEQPPVIKEHACGGDGSVAIHTLLDTEDLLGYGKFLARVVIQPNSSIGWHQHVGETEHYYILSGKGIFTDTDGSTHPVGAGDICTIRPNGSHAIANTEANELVMLAIILYATPQQP